MQLEKKCNAADSIRQSTYSQHMHYQAKWVEDQEIIRSLHCMRDHDAMQIEVVASLWIIFLAHGCNAC